MGCRRTVSNAKKVNKQAADSFQYRQHGFFRGDNALL